MSIAAEYKEKALETVKYYHSDIEIDINLINKEVEPGNSGSLVFMVKEMGTYSIALTNKQIEALPGKGERVPFLFGTADRDHIIDSVICPAEYCKKNHNDIKVYTINFKGIDAKIKRISIDEVFSMYSDWKRKAVI